jgi:hypothetical protein
MSIETVLLYTFHKAVNIFEELLFFEENDQKS